MSNQDRVVIVGGGQAGARAIQALRAAGHEGSIVLVGDEAALPYERPPLSKRLLIGDEAVDSAYVLPEAWYRDNGVELHLGTRVTEIDRAGKRIVCESGTNLAYDKLLLATGSRIRPLPVAGHDLPGIHYLRTIEDCLGIREKLTPGTRLAVIGGGFIGLEVAASARKRGCEVTVLEVAPQLMGRAVAQEIAEWFADLHRREGVELRLNVRIEGIEQAETALQVRLAGDERVAADLVVVGIGILPNAELAQAAGLEVDNGIVVDAFGQTSDPAIFAAGDCVSQPNELSGGRVRLESYQNAQDQAKAVARNMLAVNGERQPYEDRLWVWSDQYDTNLQMLGRPVGWSGLVFRGEPSEGRFTAFYMTDDNRVAAVNTVNNGKEMRLAERLIRSGTPVDPAQLADPAVNLRTLAPR